MKATVVQNPILRGFHPDPCICKANGIYYLITSTFEWLPGVSLYESEDLVNWKSKGGILQSLNLEGIPDSAGIWAPALSYDNGRFYLIYTICKQIDGYFKDVENYVVTAENIEGPWSEPVFVNASGFDPSMYHENGRHYVVNPQWDPRPLEGHQKFNGLILQEFDFEKGMVGEAKVVYHGSGWGSAEGPHLMKKDQYYYILAAEGGTGRHHSVCVARSENIWGPYEVSPYTPMITAWEQDTILKKSGHGNLVETDHGEWYLVHLCGRYLDRKNVCVLGRETALQKVEWTDGWPHLASGTCVPQENVEVAVDNEKVTEDIAEVTENMRGSTVAAAQSGENDRIRNYAIDWQENNWTNGEISETKFSEQLCREMEEQEWLSLRTPLRDKISVKADGIHLKGGASLTSTFSQQMIARRLESVHTEVTATLKFRPYHYAQTAGMSCYYNTKVFYYLYVGYDEKRQQRIVNLLKNDNFEFSEPLEGNYVYVPEQVENISLRMLMEQEKLQFYYAFDEENYEKIGSEQDASILSDEHASGWSYTGTVAGITAVDTFNKDTAAVFLQFEQKEL